MSKEVIQCPMCKQQDAGECTFAMVKKVEGDKTTVCCCETQAKKVKNE
jgi:hypothetical protein